MMAPDKLFILGVGAQKAGTSWLFNYLASAANVATNNIKEYHIWDALDGVPSSRNRLITKEQSQMNSGLRTRYFLQQSPDNYFGYFLHLLQAQAKTVTCDITPAYSGLKQETFRSICDGFAKRQVTTKAVFLIRDPVERCWSSARMKCMNALGHSNADDDFVVAHAFTEESEARTRYDQTLARLEAVFTPAHLHVGLYEEMFELPQLAQLSDFCQVTLRPSLVERKINLSRKTLPLGQGAARKIVARYRPVYDFVASRFPKAVQMWDSYRYL